MSLRSLVHPCSSDPKDSRSLWQNPVIQAIARHTSSKTISAKVIDSEGVECWIEVRPDNPFFHVLNDRLQGLDARMEEVIWPDSWPRSTAVDNPVDNST